MYEQARPTRRRVRRYTSVVCCGFLLGFQPCIGRLQAVAHATDCPAAPAQTAPATQASTPPGNMVVYQCSDALASNKARIAAAVRHWGGDDTQVLTALAMAMAETQCCESKDRDMSKDNTPSQNYSCFNMNKDMLQMAGWMGTPDLNDEANLDNAVFYLMTAWHLWGIDSTLNFHRGGRQAWQDGVSYGAGDYRAVIKAVVEYLRAHPETQTDKTRVGFNLEHV